MNLANFSPIPPSTAARSTYLGFGYAGSCRSALEVGGGDLCDVVPLSETSLLLVMADVMGKGLSASLFAASLRTLVRAVASSNSDPGECLREINELMFDQLSSADMFITAQLVMADLHRREFLVGNAGHCPMLISDGDGRTQTIAPYGMPLGIGRDALFESECVEFAPFSTILLYTDGVTETRNPSGHFFGQERLESWFQQAVTNHRMAAALKCKLQEELLEFQQGDITADDQSFLLLSDETPRPCTFLNRDTVRWFLPWRHSRSAASLAAGS